jgi:hypothetical protein
MIARAHSQHAQQSLLSINSQQKHKQRAKKTGRARILGNPKNDIARCQAIAEPAKTKSTTGRSENKERAVYLFNSRQCDGSAKDKEILGNKYVVRVLSVFRFSSFFGCSRGHVFVFFFVFLNSPWCSILRPNAPYCPIKVFIGPIVRTPFSP